MTAWRCSVPQPLNTKMEQNEISIPMQSRVTHSGWMTLFSRHKVDLLFYHTRSCLCDVSNPKLPRHEPTTCMWPDRTKQCRCQHLYQQTPGLCLGSQRAQHVHRNYFFCNHHWARTTVAWRRGQVPPCTPSTTLPLFRHQKRPSMASILQRSNAGPRSAWGLQDLHLEFLLQSERVCSCSKTAMQHVLCQGLLKSIQNT